MSSDIDSVFGALADPTRRTILETVTRDGAASASALARRLPIVITRQGIARHLSVLEDAGLVERRRAGKEVRFQPRADRIQEAMSWMAGIAAEWDDRLAALARLAAEIEQIERSDSERASPSAVDHRDGP